MLDRLPNVLIVCLLIFLSVWVFVFQSSYSVMMDTENMRLVKDGAGAGRDLYVPQKPKRVVILSASSFDLWVNLGGAESIVGVSRFKNADPSLYEKLNSETVVFGAYAYKSPEIVMHLRPDLVIMNGYDAAQDFMGEFLRRENIPLLTMPGRTVEDTYREIELFGELIGTGEKAAAEIARLKKNIAANSAKYDLAQKKKALLVFGTSESFSMFTPYTRQGNMLELSGGENIIERSLRFLDVKYLPLSLEYASWKNPDRVFFINHGNQSAIARKIKEALAENSAWYTIKAVQAGRVDVLPEEYFIVNPGLKTDYAINKISKILYGE
ncbi:MAG: ABC transporter substrate-binding protein [Sporomusaceae bacterium]|jgi:iron complex transport system substrate-binding protein|nr:ABC transporter substrate-binding protein [Sporomusaceae bacterium]